MNELLSKFEAGELIGLVAVGGGLLLGLVCGLAAILAEAAHKNRQLSLKQEMLARGMSADEIRTVIDAGTKHSTSIASSVAAPH